MVQPIKKSNDYGEERDLHISEMLQSWLIRKSQVTRHKVLQGTLVLVRKDYSPKDEENTKLTPIDTGTFDVTEPDDNSCIIIKTDGTVEKITIHRVLIALEVENRQLKSPHREHKHLGMKGRNDRPRLMKKRMTQRSTQSENIVEHDPQEDETNLYRVRWNYFGAGDGQ